MPIDHETDRNVTTLDIAAMEQFNADLLLLFKQHITKICGYLDPREDFLLETVAELKNELSAIETTETDSELLSLAAKMKADIKAFEARLERLAAFKSRDYRERVQTMLVHGLRLAMIEYEKDVVLWIYHDLAPQRSSVARDTSARM